MHTHTSVAGNLDLIGFLVLGLLGGFAHCVAMCSPFVLLVSRRFTQDGRPAAVAQAWYAVGRIGTYIVLGAIAGGLGQAIGRAGSLFGLQRAAAIIAGGTLVLFALATLLRVGPGSRSSYGFTRLTLRLGAKMPGHPLAVGLVLGLLPCGLLYSAVVAALARGSAIHGAAGLAAFGLGTLPALVLVSLADSFLIRQRPLLNAISQVFVFSMGAWLLWNGLRG